MLHSRKLNTCINKIHERSLRLVYKDYTSSFNELLRIDDTKTIHQRNLQLLMIEMFKIKTGIAPVLIKEIFEVVNLPYDLRNDFKLKSDNINTVFYGTESISFLGPKLWSKL